MISCRFCGNEIVDPFLDLGEQPEANALLREKDLIKDEPKFPLKVYRCANCSLVQLPEAREAKAIFNKDYVYYSSFSKAWLAHCRAYADEVIDRLSLTKKSLVVEVASNDGYLLQYFVERDIPHLGIEPAGSAANEAKRRGVNCITEFFSEELANRLADSGQMADLIIANNVLAHTPTLNNFVRGLRRILKEEGTITIEVPSFLQAASKCQFDTIYHEHYSYFSMSSLSQIFGAHQMVVYDVEELSTHGGSLRLYISHQKRAAGVAAENVAKSLEQEERAGMKSEEFYTGFARRVDAVRENFVNFLAQAKSEGKKLAGYGAAAKSSTFLNFCRIGVQDLPYVVDISPIKQGKFIPGCRIPIVSESRLREERPDYVIIFAWNLKSEIMSQLAYVKEWNGRFVTAVPELEISQ